MSIASENMTSEQKKVKLAEKYSPCYLTSNNFDSSATKVMEASKALRNIDLISFSFTIGMKSRKVTAGLAQEQKLTVSQKINIPGRLPENSRR